MKSKPAAVLILLVILGPLLPAQALAEFTVPTGFDDQSVVARVPAPTAIDWLPTGELLIATQGGVLYRRNGTGAQSILDLSGAVCSQGEMGLLGLAVDPAFAANRFIYLYYTHNKGGCEAANRANRVSRFSVDDNGVPGGETVLIDNIAAPGTNHNAGDLQFDRNGLLYISVGDGGPTPDTARRLNTLNGKILRIDRNGGIPGDNPFTGSDSVRCNIDGNVSDSEKKCKEIYATGLRNPFRIAFDPDDVSGHRFFINDVGGSSWEEIDAGAPGADYGWNIREGPCLVGSQTNCPPDNQFVGPIFAYPRSAPAPFAGCTVITGGVFVPENGANWPDQYDDAYLFADLGCAKIFALRNESPVAPRGSEANQEDQQTERKKNKKDRKGKKQKKGKKGKRERRRDRRDEKQDRRKSRRDNSPGSPTVAPDPIPPGQAPEVFATGGPGSGAIHLKFGPDGVLYYTTFDGGGQVRRIAHPG